jgi:hypothetical protein
MSTLAQTPEGDIALVSGRATVISRPCDVAAVKLFNKFRSFKGEWFLDTRVGVPWYEFLGVKNPDLGVIRQIFTRVILSVEEVTSIKSLEMKLNKDRTLDFTFEAVAIDGQVVAGGSGVPFIVVVS